MPDTSPPARGQGTDGRSAGPEEQDLPLNYVAPNESDVLRDEVDQMVDDVCTGKIPLTRYSSVDEYLKHVDKVISE